jgi:putative ABC transport system permease protein
MTVLVTDENFASTYQMKMKEGDFFHANQGSYQPARVVLNEAAAKAFGWNQAVGNKIRLQGVPVPFEVYGITENFHFASMHEAIRPIVFIHVKNRLIYRNLSFRLQTNNLSKAIAGIEKKWAAHFPDAPFDYAFMDDKLQQLYQSEIQLRKASNVATVLSLIIVLLGVSGLISLNVAKRTKEVGVRKVLGATVIHIIVLFLKEFALLIVIANLVAWPLVYLAMNSWLEAYVYRITISWLPFGIAGAVTLLITCLVVGMQSVKTALTNPVKSLRNE